MSNFFKKEDGSLNIVKVAICAVAAIAVVVVLIFLIKGVAGGAGGQEKKLTKRMEELGVSFYEDFYYKQVGSTDEARAEFVSNYAQTGIKVKLDDLARFNSEQTDAIRAEFVNKKSGESCDMTNSKVTIYPQSPYAAKDHKVEVNLVCGFDKDSKKDEKNTTTKDAKTTTTTQKATKKDSKKN
jgi:hypothetical protein